VTSDPDFKVMTFLKSNIGKTARLKEKVAIAHYRKVYLAYGMVPCLVTLTDLWRRRAGCQHQLSFLFLLGCQNQCKWLTGKTRLRNDLYKVLMGTLNPTHSLTRSLSRRMLPQNDAFTSHLA